MNSALVIPDNLTGKTLKVVTIDYVDSNKVDLSKYYEKTQTSSSIELDDAFIRKQDKLSNAQLSAIDYSMSQLMTTITFSDGSTAEYSWDGNISKQTMKNAGLINDADEWQKTIVDVKLGENIVSITTNAFENCSQLSNISLTNSVYSIGDNVFSNCYSLSGIKLPDNLSSIGQNAFSNCSSLINVEIPNKVKNIGANAFINCDNLTALTFVGQQLSTIHSMYSYPFGLDEEIIDTKVIQGYNIKLNPKNGIDGVLISNKTIKDIATENIITALQAAEIDSTTDITAISLIKVITFIKALSILNPSTYSDDMLN